MVGWKTSSRLGWEPRLEATALKHQLQKYWYLGKTCLNCKSGIFQNQRTKCVTLCSHRSRRTGRDWAHLLPVSPEIEWNTEATYPAAFQTILLLLHLLSHDPLGLRSHVALGFSGWCQGVSNFPGESGARGRERGPVTPAGRAEQEVTVVLTAELSEANYGFEVFYQCLCCFKEL